MQAHICTTCGTQYPPADLPPKACPICEDERQYMLPTGQGWTTLERLRLAYMNAFRDEAGVLGIGTAPSFGIGQRALLVRTPAGNVLWDCIALIDASTIELIRGVGGISAIAISHPHYYTTMLEWSAAFGGVPIHLHADDRAWIMREGPSVQLWEGETEEIAPGLTLIRCGGHFAGGTVMHSAFGKGAIFSGDILQVVADRRFLGFMRSYPNFVPLGAAAVQRIAGRLAPWRYDAIYGAFWDKVIPHGGQEAMRRSVERHLRWLSSPPE
jgi:hypothetical protein